MISILSEEDINYIKQRFGFEELQNSLEFIVSILNQINNDQDDIMDDKHKPLSDFYILDDISDKILVRIRKYINMDKNMGEWKIKKEFEK